MDYIRVDDEKCIIAFQALLSKPYYCLICCIKNEILKKLEEKRNRNPISKPSELFLSLKNIQNWAILRNDNDNMKDEIPRLTVRIILNRYLNYIIIKSLLIHM